MNSLNLVGTYEIAALLGVSRQRVQQLSKTPAFPEPAIRLNMGDAWHLDDIRAWAAETGRSLND